jgi:hypothetical protein
MILYNLLIINYYLTLSTHMLYFSLSDSQQIIIFLLILSWLWAFKFCNNPIYLSLFYNTSSVLLMTSYKYTSEERLSINNNVVTGNTMIFIIAFNGIMYNTLDTIRLINQDFRKNLPFILHHQGTTACIITSLFTATFQEMAEFWLLLEVTSIFYNLRQLFPNKYITQLNKLTYVSIRPYALYQGILIMLKETNKYKHDNKIACLIYNISFLAILFFTLGGIIIVLKKKNNIGKE